MAMGDMAFEAQSCYSLGNTYTLMKDFPKAVDFHSRHLRHAIQLRDRCDIITQIKTTTRIETAAK